MLLCALTSNFIATELVSSALAATAADAAFSSWKQMKPYPLEL